MSLECRAEFDIIHNHTYSTDNEIIEIQGLVHMKLTSMGFSCITDLLLPRTNNSGVHNQQQTRWVNL